MATQQDGVTRGRVRRALPRAGTPSIVERLSERVTELSGRTAALGAAVLICVVWAITGPYFHYSDTWQLIINTLTNLVTFVMVFLIQRSQNKDTLAVQLKLNEIIAAVRGASNELIAIEDLSEDELRTLHTRYQRLLELTDNRRASRDSVSIEALRPAERSSANHPPVPTDVPG